MESLDRRTFVGGLAAGLAATAVKPAPAAPTRPFRRRGVYFHDGFDAEPRRHAPLWWDEERWRRQIRWLLACGIDTVEFATMLEFSRIPSTDLERRKIADRLRVMDLAHSLGMRFGYLLSNTLVSTVPEGNEPGHQLRNRAVTLCPREPGNFERTMAIQRFFLETYRRADFFEEFAADWGGCHCGRCGVPEYLRYVRALAGDLAALNPKATLYADTWCIAYWGPDLAPRGWQPVFEREIAGSREVIEALPGLPRNVGLALPCHHLYRPLTFESYGGKKKTPAFPTAGDVRRARRGGRPVLAWPHFVMDDDAARAPAWGIVHSEARYIRALLLALRRAGIDQVIGNLYLPMLQLPNTFAFGRLTERPDRDPMEVLAEFARLVARREDAAALADLLAWMENNSCWQRQMPPDGRLPDLPCSLDRARAGELAERVRGRTRPDVPFPYPVDEWLADLRRSVARMTWTS